MPTKNVYIKDIKLYDEANKLVEAGEYRSFSHLVEEALRSLINRKKGFSI